MIYLSNHNERFCYSERHLDCLEMKIFEMSTQQLSNVLLNHGQCFKDEIHFLAMILFSMRILLQENQSVAARNGH